MKPTRKTCGPAGLPRNEVVGSTHGLAINRTELAIAELRAYHRVFFLFNQHVQLGLQLG